MSGLGGASAIVTGGTSGLGAAVAAAVVDAGGTAVIVGRNADAGRAFESAHPGAGRFVRADVTDSDSLGAAVQQAAEAAPRGLRVAVAAAGSAIVQKTVGRDGPHPIESFQRMLDVNLVGAFQLLRLAASAMAGNDPDEEGQRGVIVLTSSVAAFEGQMGQVAYAAAKGGIVSMVLPAARDLARSGIRVMAVVPGVFDTPFMDLLSEEARAGVAASVPFPSRLGRPDEYASLVLEIVRNPMLNGEVIRLDGALRLAAR
ncbi:MAG: SDR family NAD(P)-dependent oxidoreductase [Microbacterium ginsengisoli]|uniref:SDR family NAD(P)-dependent oxidoreductase n=1 Tax=Microbacterium TaxID=33882 RepID=UPI0006F57F49|nr:MULTISPECIES: SDR family NAD(P)-dependent oxidoreductase [Microbacterium]MBN9197191.1 SDR family NAD(P)-dependent oxidoreductase [Microbacterium ginsengisoli]KQR91148.1 3-hydroxy-2-methylbutyryl-CoA dehydrogenase [Microbacterium sp. Leaf347]KQS01160.1 3-hydroxy-2-methylbutyryl-CoA dehydrogenase [Microbacterium sp. Leaf351]KXC07196.1 3-hydroxy-2-methylbutyryl-CoA dehydrogenase [Microbacterium hominis]MBN9208641.1 SDR family NAD(P)-dependent oxidoreductase [Microbacterium ginsengisoli]